MLKVRFKIRPILAVLMSFILTWIVPNETVGQNKGAFQVPVKVSGVEEKTVSDQITLVGNAEPVAKSIVASEVSGIVEYYPIEEGDFLKKGDLLARLRSTNFLLRLKGAKAAREKIRANLLYAEKELERAKKLKDTDSIAERKYDEALYNHQALSKGLLESEAEIENLQYQIDQTRVVSPFSGFVAKEHTQIGEWINPGGPVATLLNLTQVRIEVDVPERFTVMISPQSEAKVIIKSVSDNFLKGKVHAILPQGDPDSRTFPIRIRLSNPEFKIKSGMEATVTFTLSNTRRALLVPKDAVVTAGNNRLVFSVVQGKAVPVSVNILGYYDGNVAVEGDLKQGDLVVIRGNERLRPGQPVNILK